MLVVAAWVLFKELQTRRLECTFAIDKPVLVWAFITALCWVLS